MRETVGGRKRRRGEIGGGVSIRALSQHNLDLQLSQVRVPTWKVLVTALSMALSKNILRDYLKYSPHPGRWLFALKSCLCSCVDLSAMWGFLVHP